MDYFFKKMNPVVNAQNNIRGISKLHRGERRQTSEHHEQCCVENGVEEPRIIERVAKFINWLGDREITLKSDTDFAIIAFRNRVADMCAAEVATEDAVKGDESSNGLIENAGDADTWTHPNGQCHIESSTQKTTQRRIHLFCILSRCQEGRDGKTPFEKTA